MNPLSDWDQTVQLVRRSLHPSERIKVVLKARTVPPPSATSASSSAVNEGDEEGDSVARLRILVLVTHDEVGGEQASVLVLRIRPSTSSLKIDNAIPICGEFSISIAQAPNPPPTLNPKSIPPNYQRFNLTIKARHEVEGLTFQTQDPDVACMKMLVKECKRLKELAGMADAPQTNSEALQTYSWLASYAQKGRYPNASAPTNTDLRTAHTPLHARLTPASAGSSSSGSDLADLVVVRDEWIRARARECAMKASRGGSGRRKLMLRLGTFNVNDQLPSQDLAPWLGTTGSSGKGEGVRIPPVRKTSPFSASMKHLSLDSISLNSLATITDDDDKATLVSDDSSCKTIGHEEDEAYDDPDLFVLGFQELDLSTEALLYSTTTDKADAWCKAVFAALGERAVLYEKLASKQLVGIYMLILVRKSLSKNFAEPRTCSAGVGIMGMMGNKGGVGIQLTYTPNPSPTTPTPAPSTTSGVPPTPGLPSSSALTPQPQLQTTTQPQPIVMTFVNAHLAAFDEQYDKRNSDFGELSKRLGFVVDPVGGGDDSASMASGVSGATGGSGGGGGAGSAGSAGSGVMMSVYEGDALFWMGDLNYRLDLPDSEIRETLANEHWENRYEALASYDQLKRAAKSGKAFEGFMERDIRHLPTYRFSPGVTKDALGYDTKRKPAWTDRILHLYDPKTLSVAQKTYEGHAEVTMSDHRPVSASFVVEYDSIDTKTYDDALHRYYRMVMDMDDDDAERPVLKMDTASVEFGTLEYMTPTKRVLNVTNTGKIACVFRFVPLDEGTPLAPDWLSLEPITALLLPSQTLPITLTALPTASSAARLNLGPKEVGETLILRTVGGKDHFVSVGGVWEYTCFANKLSRLVRLPKAIREIDSPDDLLDESEGVNAPREVMRLVNVLMGAQDEVKGHTKESLDLFSELHDVTHEHVRAIRECLDTGTDFPTTVPPCSYASTLVHFLASLPESIVDPGVYARCSGVADREQAFELLDMLPPSSVNVWISITAFLHFVRHQSSDPDREAQRLATIFAPLLLRDADDPTIKTGGSGNSGNPAGAGTGTGIGAGEGKMTLTPLEKRRLLMFFI